MTLIELIGCTGAGKSTLAAQLLAAYRQRGEEAWLGYDFVLRQVRLEWVRRRAIRGLLVNALALLACLATSPRNLALLRFVLGSVARLPVGLGEKLYIGRDALKNIGIDQIIRRRASGRQIILLDEGGLHIAHYLFVNMAGEPDPAQVAAFAKLAPLPDLAVYLRQAEPLLVERTLRRGHKRIPGGSPASVSRFIGRAVAVFDTLAAQPRLADRMLTVGGEQPASVAALQAFVSV